MAAAQKLEGISVCVFDAYGTLFDVASPVTKHEKALGGKSAELAALWRTKQLEYTWVRSLVGTHADFWKVSRDALDYALEALSINEAGLADELMMGMLKLELFPDVKDGLAALKKRGRRLGILSNGSPSMLDSIVRYAGLETVFEHLLSVEDVGIFKPSRRVYRLAMQKFGVQDAPSICFVSANGWDAHSAAQFGFQAVRLMRKAGSQDRLPGKISRTIATIGELDALV